MTSPEVALLILSKKKTTLFYVMLLLFVLCSFSIFGPCLSGYRCSSVVVLFFFFYMYFILSYLLLGTIFFWVHVHFTKHPHGIFDLPPSLLLYSTPSKRSSVVWTAAVDLDGGSPAQPCVLITLTNRNNNPGNKRTISFSHLVSIGRRVFSCIVLFTCFLRDLVHSPKPSKR